MTNKKGQHEASPKVKLPIHDNPRALQINEKIEQLLEKIASSRAKRLLIYLSGLDAKTTTQICTLCSIGNVSDVVASISEHLAEVNLEIINYPPPTPFKNRFGEVSRMHLWRLVELPEVEQ